MIRRHGLRVAGVGEIRRNETLEILRKVHRHTMPCYLSHFEVLSLGSSLQDVADMQSIM